MSKNSVLTITFFLIAMISFCQKPIKQEDIIEKNYQEVIDPALKQTKVPDSVKLDKYPMYPNGYNGVLEHIIKTLRYPIVARESGISGEVIVSYVVEKDGYIREINVVQSVHRVLDAEAIRIIRKMKRWVPGIKNGKPVRVEYRQPFKFTLRD